MSGAMYGDEKGGQGQGGAAASGGGGAAGVRTLEQAASAPTGVNLASAVPFNGDPTLFQGWSAQMESVLYCLDLWDSVVTPPNGTTGASGRAASVLAGDDDDEVMESGLSTSSAMSERADVDWSKKSKQAYMLLMCSLKSPELLQQMVDVPKGNAHEVWQRLKRYYSRNTQANKQHLMAQFYHLAQNNGESIAQYSA
jgi:hypothetical protein